MNYWLDLFTGTTWREFRIAGANVTGFRPSRKRQVGRVQPGDVLLCYLTGVMRWVGALEVVGPSSDTRSIWKEQDFSARLEVKPLVVLDPEVGIPMAQLEGKVVFFQGQQHAGKFDGFVRGSPGLFKRREDGDLIVGLLRAAERNPVSRPVDARKLARKPLFKAESRVRGRTVQTLVTVPEPEESSPQTEIDPVQINATTRHTEIQYQLLVLGAEMGLDVWVARNDRSRSWNEKTLGDLPRVLHELPTQFNEATQRTVELIDVLWLKGNSIVAAFEVECTTSIYSGLLRMADLTALQPNLEIKLYLVAPDERRDRVEQEIRRPTFWIREKPLEKVCGFLSFSKLMEKVDGIHKLGLGHSLRPDFLQRTAEYFDSGDDVAETHPRY